MNKLLIIIFSIIAILSITVISIKIITNNQIIESIANSQDMAKLFIKVNKQKDWETLRFFHCRPTEKNQKQSDFDQLLNLYIKGSTKYNWSMSNIEERGTKKFDISGIKSIETNELITDHIIINKQKPLISELKTKESFCFSMNYESKVIKSIL